MTDIRSLQKRLDRLEGRGPVPDFELMALEALRDDDLDLLQEANTLYRCGHSESEIAAMMGERHPQLEAAKAHYQKAFERLIEQANQP